MKQLRIKIIFICSSVKCQEYKYRFGGLLDSVDAKTNKGRHISRAKLNTLDVSGFGRNSPFVHTEFFESLRHTADDKVISHLSRLI